MSDYRLKSTLSLTNSTFRHAKDFSKRLQAVKVNYTKEILELEREMKRVRSGKMEVCCHGCGRDGAVKDKPKRLCC